MICRCCNFTHIPNVSVSAPLRSGVKVMPVVVGSKRHQNYTLRNIVSMTEHTQNYYLDLVFRKPPFIIPSVIWKRLDLH